MRPPRDPGLRPGVFLLLLGPALLAGCGDLPMPFKDNPGATALRLAAPPPSRLAIPPSGDTMLANDGATLLARDLAEALDNQEVPAQAIVPTKGDWRLDVSARLAGNQVVPRFTVRTPEGRVRGSLDGTPVAASAWANADAATLHAVADAASPDIAAMLTGIRAAQREADPNSLMHRPAKVYFAGVKGAPGDGDTALADAMRRQMPMHGDLVQSTPKGADYTLVGTVGVAHPQDGRQAVELDWRLLDASGREAGKVSQLNAVPTGTLDGAWGDVALAAATEAAGGIHEVIQRNSGRNDKPLPAPPGVEGAKPKASAS